MAKFYPIVLNIINQQKWLRGENSKIYWQTETGKKQTCEKGFSLKQIRRDLSITKETKLIKVPILVRINVRKNVLAWGFLE